MINFKALVLELLPPFLVKAFKVIKTALRKPREVWCKLPREETADALKLSRLPKYTELKIRLFNREMLVTDAQSFGGIYESYFVRESYRFVPSGARRLIIDCGANVGLSVRYWKYVQRDAKIIAFEPDAHTFEALKYNCDDLADIVLYNKAVWKLDGTVEFSAVGGDGGHLSEFVARPEAPKIIVPCVKLSSFLTEPIELLKIDIEGAEIDVLEDCADRLGWVERIFVEYHSFAGKPQRFAELIKLLENAGFRIHAHSEMEAKQPFLNCPIVNGKDFRMNIYAWKDRTETVAKA